MNSSRGFPKKKKNVYLTNSDKTLIFHLVKLFCAPHYCIVKYITVCSCRWPEAGVSNVYSGVVGGVEGGAVGVVVAHWSSSAALTPLVFAWPPVLVAAGLSWNHNTHWVSHAVF